ncbi:unnamed protein product, partial [Rotaria sp. Silwood1]
APGGDIRVTFSPINTKSTYQTDIPAYNLAIGGCCNSSSYIRRANNSNATKVVQSSAVESLADKNRCTYWFSFDSQTGWVSFGKGTDTSLSKALLKWQDPSPLLNLNWNGQSSRRTYDCSAGPTITHQANGIGWYFARNTTSWNSWGFVLGSNSVVRGNCDGDMSNNPAYRLCWHTGGTAGGYQCGSMGNLDNSNSWEKLIYHAM